MADFNIITDRKACKRRVLCDCIPIIYAIHRLAVGGQDGLSKVGVGRLASPINSVKRITLNLHIILAYN